MKEFQSADVIFMPSAALSYVEHTFFSGGWYKWILASLIAIFADIQEVFGELFFIVILLWLADLIIGVLRAFHDPEVGLEWSKMFRSVIKLIVIGVGVLAIHFIEQLIHTGTGINTEGKLCGATLLVIGTAEAFSIVDNLVYFFPGLTKIASSIKEMLGKVRNNGSDS